MIERLYRGLVPAFTLFALVSTGCQNPVLFPSSVARTRLSVDEMARMRPEPASIPLAGSFGWFFKSDASSNAMIMFHGNAETVDDYAQWAVRLAQSGVSILLVEFPGYREVSGNASQNSIRRVALAGYDWLGETGYAADQITVFGRSVGAAVACDLSRHRELKRLVLVSPFTTLGEAARNAGFPRAAGLGKFNNRRAVAGFTGQLLIVHGRRDEIVPFAMGSELVEVSGTPDENRFFLALDAGHNDLLARYETILTERLVRFASGRKP